MKLRIHPLANQFPMMSKIEYEALKKDIKENGLTDNILLFEGKILDGRNRYKACRELGIDLDDRTDEFPGDSEAARKLSASANLTRRHLSKSQKAMVIVKAGLASPPSPENRRPKDGKDSIRQAADRYGVNHMTIYKAFFVYAKDKKRAKKVLDGKLSVGKAEAEIRSDENETVDPNSKKPRYHRKSRGVSSSEKLLAQVRKLLSTNKNRKAERMALDYLQNAADVLQSK